MQWVQAAINHDRVSAASRLTRTELICPSQFEAEGDDSHSSSIVDLIDSCKSATDFILALDWPNEYENAKYLTGLSQVGVSLSPSERRAADLAFPDHRQVHRAVR